MPKNGLQSQLAPKELAAIVGLGISVLHIRYCRKTMEGSWNGARFE